MTDFPWLLIIPRPMTRADKRASIDPHEVAEHAGRWVGRVPVSAFERLAPLIGKSDADVEVELTFESDSNGLVRVNGVVCVDAVLECQRCLEEVSQKIVADLDLRLTSSEEKLTELMPALDVMVIDAGPIPIVEIVEDDLIMSIPARVCATELDCPNEPRALSLGASVDEDDATRPFAGLRALKNLNREEC